MTDAELEQHKSGLERAGFDRRTPSSWWRTCDAGIIVVDVYRKSDHMRLYIVATNNRKLVDVAAATVKEALGKAFDQLVPQRRLLDEIEEAMSLV